MCTLPGFKLRDSCKRFVTWSGVAEEVLLGKCPRNRELSLQANQGMLRRLALIAVNPEKHDLEVGPLLVDGDN